MKICFFILILILILIIIICVILKNGIKNKKDINFIKYLPLTKDPVNDFSLNSDHVQIIKSLLFKKYPNFNEANFLEDTKNIILKLILYIQKNNTLLIQKQYEQNYKIDEETINSFNKINLSDIEFNKKYLNQYKCDNISEFMIIYLSFHTKDKEIFPYLIFLRRNFNKNCYELNADLFEISKIKVVKTSEELDCKPVFILK